MLLASDEERAVTPPPLARIAGQTIIYRTSYLYLCPGLESAAVTARPAGTLILSASPKEFEVEVDGRREPAGIAIVKPFVPKRIHAVDVPLVSFGLHPNHPMYRVFTGIADPGVTTYRYGVFAELHAALESAVARGMTPQAGMRILEWALDAVTANMPLLPPLDPRVQQVMTMLIRDHFIPLDELADATCLSYFRLSHLFTQELGISLRQYVLSLKIDTACQNLGLGGSLTDAAHAGGFCDSAHLTKVWVKWFGGPPSHFLKNSPFRIEPSVT